MKRTLTLSKLVLAIALLLSTFAIATPAQAACNPPDSCEAIYAPVICEGDVIYDNQCYADAACAKKCKPYVWW
jgi:hypothetical protein